MDLMNGIKGHQFDKQARKNRTGDFSQRKELNRSVQLFESVNMVEYFQKYIGETIQKLNQNNLKPNFTNQNTVTNMESVLQFSVNIQN